MAEIVVIAGTSDARHLIEELLKLGFKVTATVTTVYGRGLLGENKGLKIRQGELDRQAMADFLWEEKPKLLIDASHPFAAAASANAQAACQEMMIPYLRLERKETFVSSDPNLILIASFEEAAQRLTSLQGNIFLTIGSKNLRIFTEKIPDFQKRLFVRVLPQATVLAQCEALGLTSFNLIAAQGSFSAEMNIAMLRHFQAEVMVAKESGQEGGTPAKIEACRQLGIPLLLIGRPPAAYGRKFNSLEALLYFVQNYLRGDA